MTLASNQGICIKTLTLLVFMCFAAVGHYAPAESSGLRVALGNGRINFSPLSMPNQNTLFINRQIHCQLTRLIEGEVRGEAAESFVFDHAKSQILYTLKSGLTFSDGTPVTAADVAATFKSYRANRPYVRNVFDWIARVEATDGTHVRIVYRKNPTSILRDLSTGLFPILRRRDTVNFKTTDWTIPTGCGTFRVASRTTDAIDLVHRTRPSRKISFRLFGDNEIAAEDASQFDLVPISILGTIPNSLREMKIFDPYQIYVGLNTSLPKWRRLRDRCRALAGFSGERIAPAFVGRAVTANDYYPKGIFGYDFDSKFNQTLRDGAGTSSGRPPKPSCLAVVRVSVPKSMESQFALHDEYGQLPVIPILDAADFKTKFDRSKCDFMVIGLKSNSLDAYEYQLLYSEPRTNFMHAHDTRLTQLITTGQGLLDRSQRLLQYRRIAETIAKSCTIKPLVTVPLKSIFVRRGLVISGLGELPLNDVLLDPPE